MEGKKKSHDPTPLLSAVHNALLRRAKLTKVVLAGCLFFGLSEHNFCECDTLKKCYSEWKENTRVCGAVPVKSNDKDFFVGL